MEKPKIPKLYNIDKKFKHPKYNPPKTITQSNLVLTQGLKKKKILNPKTKLLNRTIFRKKPFLKSPYNTSIYGWVTCWQNLHNHYKTRVIGMIIKKICRYEGLVLNKLYVQLSHKSLKVLVNNLGVFSEHRAVSRFIKYRRNFAGKLFKKRLLKAATVIMNITNSNSIKIKFYNSYIPINFKINIVERAFKKEKRERYFKASLQVVYAVFKGNASSQILGNLIYTYTRRNPRRIRFISFIKRLLDWHFVTITGFGSKVTGVRTEIKGRFNAKSRAKKQILSVGRIRINEGASPVDYRQLVATTKFGSLGIKVWVCPKM
jgi:Ribosomal protein S3, C-terminal domain